MGALLGLQTHWFVYYGSFVWVGDPLGCVHEHLASIILMLLIAEVKQALSAFIYHPALSGAEHHLSPMRLGGVAPVYLPDCIDCFAFCMSCSVTACQLKVHVSEEEYRCRCTCVCSAALRC